MVGRNRNMCQFIQIGALALCFFLGFSTALAADYEWEMVYETDEECSIYKMTLLNEETIVFGTEEQLCLFSLTTLDAECIESYPYRWPYCVWGPESLWITSFARQEGLPPVWKLGAEGPEAYYPVDVTGMGKPTIFALWIDEYGHPWVAADLSVQLFDGKDWQVFWGDDELTVVCDAIGPGPGGALVGTQYGIFHWAHSGDFLWLYTKSNTGLPVTCPIFIYQDSRGYYWIGGKHALIVWCDRNCCFSLYEMIEGLDSAVIAIDEDEQGNVWIGTSEDGVVVIPADGSRIRNVPPPPSDDETVNSIDSIICAPDGFTYVGSGAAIYAIDRGYVTASQCEASSNVYQ